MLLRKTRVNLIKLYKFVSHFSIRSQMVRIIPSIIQKIHPLEKEVPSTITISWLESPLFIFRRCSTVTTKSDSSNLLSKSMHHLHPFLGSYILSSKPCNHSKFVMWAIFQSKWSLTNFCIAFIKMPPRWMPFIDKWISESPKTQIDVIQLICTELLSLSGHSFPWRRVLLYNWLALLTSLS